MENSPVLVICAVGWPSAFKVMRSPLLLTCPSLVETLAPGLQALRRAAIASGSNVEGKIFIGTSSEGNGLKSVVAIDVDASIDLALVDRSAADRTDGQIATDIAHLDIARSQRPDAHAAGNAADLCIAGADRKSVV